MNKILYLGLDPTHYQTKGEIVHWPIIAIKPRPLTEPALQIALSSFDHYSHLIITSKSTVAILKDYLPRFGIPLEKWKNKFTLAVGKVTAKHLENCGIKPNLIAETETAEGIIEELQKLSLANTHFFWPHSSKARPVIKNYLISCGLPFTACVLYDPLPCKVDALPNIETFDEIVFTSPSTVDAFLHLFGYLPSNIRLTPIGPITTHALNEAQLKQFNSDLSL